MLLEMLLLTALIWPAEAAVPTGDAAADEVIDRFGFDLGPGSVISGLSSKIPPLQLSLRGKPKRAL